MEHRYFPKPEIAGPGGRLDDGAAQDAVAGVSMSFTRSRRVSGP